MCVWECFHKKLVFESVNWVKHSSLTNMDRHHLIHWRSQIEQKRRERENSLSLLELGHSSSLAFDIGVPGSWAFGLQDLHQNPMYPPLPFFSATPLAFLVLRPWVSNWLIPPLSWFSCLQTAYGGIFSDFNHASQVSW